MKDKNRLYELDKYLKNPAYLDLEPQLAMQIAKRLVKKNKSLKTPLNNIKLSILSNFNLEFIIDPIYFCLYQRGIYADISILDYGTMITELLDPSSKTYKIYPDYLLIWPTFRDIQKYKVSTKSEISFWSSLWKISTKKNIKIFQVLFDKPPYININNSYNSKKSNLISHINKTNIGLEKKYSKKISFINIETLQINIGAKDWHDDRIYSMCKQPFSFDALPEISQFISSNIAAKIGKNKKVLIFDLDNTIWGGEIGDLGNKGIILGKETSEGEDFINFQHYIKQLGKNGIILAVCSKNQEKIAKNVFLKHPDMVIKLEDISCFVANFEDKAANITYIKKFLNVNYESIVFIDDSKVECEWIRRKLPDITTINLVGDASSFSKQLDRLGLFIKGAYTEEDANRVRTFRTLEKIETAKSNALDLQAFLKNLKPVLTLEEVFPYAAERVEQLLQKTNQFKLNSYILDKEEIKKNKNNIIALRFTDKLNDYGIVIIVVFEIKKKIINIKNWVMSCRVFSRNIEFAVLLILKKLAKRKLCNKISLEFVQSKQNKAAEEAITKMGFKPTKNSSVYDVDVEKIITKSNIKIKNLSRLIKL